MKIEPIARLLYGISAAVFLIVGASVLLLGTGLLPDSIKAFIMEITQGDRNTIHIIQELGSLLVFAGLISFWFVRHYKQSKFFHWSMTIFWALFALVHFFVAGGPFHASRGAAINTIPFALFLIVGLLRKG